MNISNLQVRKNTLAFTARIDARSFVTIARFFAERGVRQFERSRVANDAMEYLASIIRNQHPELTCTSHNDAVIWMKEAGFGDMLKEGNRNRGLLVDALALENLAGEQSSNTSLVDAIERELQKRASVSPEEMVARADKRMDDMKNILGVLPKDIA